MGNQTMLLAISSPLARVALLSTLSAATALNLLLVALRLEPTWPISPYEPALLAEGWRWNHGLQLYGGPGGDHATHLYGPLFTVLLGCLQKVFGFNFPAVRAFFFLVGTGACLWLAHLVAPAGRRGAWAFAATVLFAANLQTGLCFTLSWPDMPALLCAVGALAAMRWERDGRTTAAGGAAAILLVLMGFFIKQTAAMVALILAALWAFSAAYRRRSGAWLLAPAAAVGLVLLVLPALFPGVHDQMVRVPASVSIPGGRFFEGLGYLLRSHPLFWLALGAAGFGGWPHGREGEARPWAAAGVIVLAASAWTYAKAGGYLNSLLPATLFLSVAALWLLFWLPEKAAGMKEPRRFIAPALGGALVVTLLAGGLESAQLVGMTHGDESYFHAIECARGLKGRVVSPEDPSIALRAKGTSGTAIYFELDSALVAGGWSSTPPERVVRELAGADWLITVRASYPSVLNPAWLQAHGWQPVDRAEGEGKSAYQLWTREGTDLGTPLPR